MDKMAQALAILTAGRSFIEASDIAGIPAADIMRAWSERTCNKEK